MINKSPVKRTKTYYEALGPPKGVLSPRDFYRFKRVRKYLYGSSVFDVGCGYGDFLKLINPNHQIGGTEVNKERVDYCNQVLGQNAIRLANLDERLDLEDSSFDTVVCSEVLEHLEDPEKALKELVRVARKRVIITVPFNEKIRYVLCVHCARYTPYSGHLHSFDKENIRGIIPDNARLVKIELICNGVLIYFPRLSFVFRLPVLVSFLIDKILNHIFPRAAWILLILDKNNATGGHY